MNILHDIDRRAALLRAIRPAVVVKAALLALPYIIGLVVGLLLRGVLLLIAATLAGYARGRG